MKNELKSMLENLDIDPDKIDNKKIKETILYLFNLIEDLASGNRELQIENQKLRDENNRLKGENGKPNIKPNNNKSGKKRDISSEKERKEMTPSKKNKRKSKKEKIKIDRTEICLVDPKILPPDAEFKGYDIHIVQGLIIKTDNVEFKKEVYYSASLHKTYIGPLPLGYEGDFDSTIKALTIILQNAANVSEPKILELLKNFGTHISAGTISNILIKNKEIFHQEKDELYKAGLESTNYQQIDDTGARVNGENCYTQIICNPLYTAYFTTERKDRLTVLDVLTNFKQRAFCFNDETFRLLEQFNMPKKIIIELEKFEKDKDLTEDEIEKLLEKYLPEIGKIQKVRILESAAIASYHKDTGHLIVKLLLCDDAPQFKLLTEELALCWVHDGRHYKKVSPVIPYNIKKLEDFREEYWNYYHKLLRYKEQPSEELANQLSEKFDELFSTETGYKELDERILKSEAKKREMLMVLKYPDIPLHNNESELGARAKIRRRDVSLQTKTEEGTKASDTFLTIVQTAKKLGISAYEYIFDRVSKRFELPSLAEVIKARGP